MGEAPDELVMQVAARTEVSILNLNCDRCGALSVEDLRLWTMERIQQEAEAESVRQSQKLSNKNQ